MKIFYLGPEGSYSYIAVKNGIKKESTQFISCKNFSEIVNNTLVDSKSLGVLPIENSITSDIHENIDFIFKNNLYIVYELFLLINLHLIGLKNTHLLNIRKVFSHPRALAQCTKFIAENHLKTDEVSSTASAGNIILEKKDISLGAIGSKELILNPKLKIIKENIGNDKYNMTRFVFISRNQNSFLSDQKNKITIIFKLSHTPGSLAKLLNEFAMANLNLTKIESRPIPGTTWEYMFWVDIEDKNSLDVQILKNILEKNTISNKIIGVYQKGEIIES